MTIIVSSILLDNIIKLFLLSNYACIIIAPFINVRRLDIDVYYMVQQSSCLQYCYILINNSFVDILVGCDATTKHNEEEPELVDEKGVSGYTARVGESSTKMKTDNGYAEEHASKTSSVMHEETSDDSYLQVRI